MTTHHHISPHISTHLYHSSPRITTHHHSSPFITTHHHSYPLIPIHIHSTPLIPTQLHSSPLITLISHQLPRQFFSLFSRRKGPAVVFNETSYSVAAKACTTTAAAVHRRSAPAVFVANAKRRASSAFQCAEGSTANRSFTDRHKAAATAALKTTGVGGSKW